MVEIVDHHGRFAMFAADGVVVAEVRQACVGAELAQVGVLFVVMPAAAVVMASGVAINHGSGQIARNDFVDGQSRGTAVQSDAQLVEQLDGAAADAATDDIGAALGSKEARHGTMLVLRGLLDNGFGDFSVFNGDESHLRGFAEMRPKLAVGSGNGYFLSFHFLCCCVSCCKETKKRFSPRRKAFFCTLAPAKTKVCDYAHEAKQIPDLQHEENPNKIWRFRKFV